MSDTVFRERAARRQRMYIIIGLLVLTGVCAVFAVYNTFYDRCTNSFDRTAPVMVRAYLQAISSGQTSTVENCWDRVRYFDLNSGCSELCITRTIGIGFQVSSINPDQQETNPNGRETMQAQVGVTCPDGREENGQLTIDRVGGLVPWKHWRVIQSSVGGSAAEPWCKQ